MKAIRIVVAALLGALVFLTGAGAQENAIEQKHNELLYPVVLVRGVSGSGSGTVVFSGQNKTGDYETYILTADHVIEDACQVSVVWDPFVGADVKREIRSTVRVEFYVYRDLSRAVGTTVIEASIVAREPKADVALLKLRSATRAEHVAPLWPKGEVNDLKIFQPVYAVGAQLGHPPLATVGEIQNLDIEIDGHKYVLVTSPIIYGSSGGTVFAYSEKRMGWEVIGIPARGSLTGYGQMVTHLGKAVAIWTIYKVLDENCYQFIYDPNKTIEDCAEARKRKAEREKALLPKALPENPQSSEWPSS